jgi:hypothetical protein
MKTLKKKLINFFKFLCMVVLLGTQSLLHGSWSNTNPEQETA